MTIRYKCEKCDAVLTIRDDKAGKPAKCPKCQAEFVVPKGEESSEKQSDSSASEAPKWKKPSAESGASKKPVDSSKSATAQKTLSESGKQKSVSEKSGKKKRPAKQAEKPKEFDPAEFLLDGSEGGAPAPAAPAKPMATSPKPPAGAKPKATGPKSPSKKKKPEVTIDPIEANRPSDRETFEESDEDRKSRLKEVYGNTSAEIAASALSSTSDSAEILLDAAMDDSRRKAAQDIEEEKAGPDYTEVAKYFGMSYGLPAAGIIVGAVLLYMISDYMMGGGLKIPPLGKVTGVVTLDGSPVPNAVVTFIPVGEEGGVRENVRAASGMTDETGKYTLLYTEGVRGTAVGKNRIQITGTTPEGLPMLIPGFGPGSNESRDVESGNQEIDFSVSTK